MDGLINAILKLSREGRRTLNPERIDLGAFLKAVADAVRHQVVDAGGEVAIEVERLRQSSRTGWPSSRSSAISSTTQ